MESSASDTIEFAAPQSQAPNFYFTTFLGFFVAFSTLLTSQAAIMSLGTRLGLSPYASWMLSSSVHKSISIAVLLGIVVFVERRPLRSVGLVPLTRLDVGLGLGLFVIIVIVSAGYTALLHKTFPGFTSGVATEQLKRLQNVPVAFFLFDIFLNGFFEEIGARGYAINRLQALTGSLLIASTIALVLDLGLHVPFWGWKYAILILPAQTMFVLMYIWRRNISACIIAHILVDALYVVFSVWGMTALSHFVGKDVHAALASQAYYSDDYKGAIAEYSKALRQHPAETKLLGYRATAEYWNGDITAAFQDLDEIIRRDPANVDAYEARSTAYFKIGWYEQALSEADKAVSIAPKKNNPYSYRAYAFAALKQYDKAVADLSDAIKYSPAKDSGLGDLYYRRGLVYSSMRDYDHAIADLTEAIKLDGNGIQRLENRAAAYIGKKQDDRAIVDLTDALRIDLKATNLYLDRAATYQSRHQYDLAFADLTRAVEASPDDSAAQNALAWMMSTCPDQKFRDGKDALTHANQACELTSWQKGDFIDTLAAACAEAGNFPQAIMWQQRAIALMKSDTKEQQQDSAKRLELYKAKQPYRDTQRSV